MSLGGLFTFWLPPLPQHAHCLLSSRHVAYEVLSSSKRTLKIQTIKFCQWKIFNALFHHLGIVQYRFSSLCSYFFSELHYLYVHAFMVLTFFVVL